MKTLARVLNVLFRPVAETSRGLSLCAYGKLTNCGRASSSNGGFVPALDAIKAIAVSAWLLTGCGNSPEPEAVAPAKGASKRVAQESTQPDEPETNQWIVQNVIFEDDPNVGQDPFFPNSERRNVRPAAPEETPVAGSSVLSQLNLIAIVQGTPPRAYINRQFFQKGQSGTVKISNGKPVRIRCVEVRQNSVMLEVEGAAGAVELLINGRK